MPSPVRPDATRRLRAVALATALIAGAALAGCFTPAIVKGVRTACATEVAPYPATEPSTSPAKAPSGLSNPAASASPEKLRIGTLLPRSGPSTAAADRLRSAADLAAEQLSRSGFGVTLVHEDSGGDAAGVRAGFDQLRAAGASAVIGSLGDALTRALLDEAVPARILVLASTTSAPDLTLDRDTGGYFYRTSANAAYEGQALADLLWNDHCRSATLFISSTNATMQAVAARFVERYQSLGGLVPAQLSVPDRLGASAARDLVGRAGTVPEPEALVLLAPPAESAEILRAAFDDGRSHKAATFLASWLEGSAFIDAAGKDPNGQPLAAGLRGARHTPRTTVEYERFRAAYFDRTGIAPSAAEAGAYDSVYALALSASCAGATGAEHLRDWLRVVWNRDPGDADVSPESPATAVQTARYCKVNFKGATDDLDWLPSGDRAGAAFSHWTVLPDGSTRTVRSGVWV